MNHYRIIIAVSVGATLPPTGLAPSVSPALADSNGHCYVYKERATSVWGWRDGTDPQRHQILSLCSDGYEYPIPEDGPPHDESRTRQAASI
jgi:hypothetical protein